ncbi:hypothetical protein CF065_03520 [Clostridium sporogenes]
MYNVKSISRLIKKHKAIIFMDSTKTIFYKTLIISIQLKWHPRHNNGSIYKIIVKISKNLLNKCYFVLIIILT